MLKITKFYYLDIYKYLRFINKNKNNYNTSFIFFTVSTSTGLTLEEIQKNYFEVSEKNEFINSKNFGLIQVNKKYILKMQNEKGEIKKVFSIFETSKILELINLLKNSGFINKGNLLKSFRTYLKNFLFSVNNNFKFLEFNGKYFFYLYTVLIPKIIIDLGYILEPNTIKQITGKTTAEIEKTNLYNIICTFGIYKPKEEQIKQFEQLKKFKGEINETKSKKEKNKEIQELINETKKRLIELQNLIN